MQCSVSLTIYRYVTYVIKMNFGEAKFIISKYLVGKILIVGSISQPQHVYKFRSTTKGDQFVCTDCEKLKKYRTVTVVDGRITGRKDPAEDHSV